MINSYMMKLDIKIFLKKLGCALPLAVFASTVTGDPIFDAVFPHQGSCDICCALAGGHGIVTADAGPALVCNFTETFSVIENTPIPVLCFCPPVYLSRAPPAA